MPRKSKKPDVFKNIYLIGEIDDKMVKDTFINLLEDPEIEKINYLNIYICSEGGNLLECFALMDIIQYQSKDLKYQVNTFALGEIASGGFFLFLLGKERIMFPRARLFVHEHIVCDDNGTTYSEKQKDRMEEETVYNMYRSFIVKQLGITERRATILLQKNKWLTDKEINDYKIVTGAIE